MNNNENKIKPIDRFWKLLEEDKKEIYRIYFFAFFSGLLGLIIPLGIQSVINFVQAGQISTSWIILIIVVVLAVSFSGVLQILQMWISEKLQQRIFTRASFEFAYRIPRIKTDSIQNYYAPELVNRFFDVTSIQKSLSKILLDFSSAILQIVFGLVLLSLYHPLFILFTIILFIVVYIIFKITSSKGLETSIKESNYKYKVAHWLEELARTMVSFKLAGHPNLSLEKTDDLVKEYLFARKSHFKILVKQYAYMVGFKVVVAMGLLIIGGLLVIQQKINIGQFVAVEIIMLMVFASVEKLILNVENFYDLLTSLEKIGAVTDLPLEKEHGECISEEAIKSSGLKVELQNVSFQYQNSNKRTLENISFAVNLGERVCITGYNDSGKSTLIQLISGLNSTSEGNMLYNDLPIGNFNLSELRTHIGDSLSHQKVFEGTIAENISIGRKDVKFDDLIWAAEKVGLMQFIKNLKDGFNSKIDPLGQKLPNSIVNKILLARSICHKPKLLLLEYALVYIEVEEKQKIIDFLTNKNNPWTLIAVSADPYFASKCDRMIVMKDGKIIEQDSYNSIKNKPWFKSMYYA